GHHLTLLCETRQGYRNLCRLITMAHAATRLPTANCQLPTQPRIGIADLERHSDGLICLSGCARDGAVAARLERREYAAAAQVAGRLLRAFGAERFRTELAPPPAGTRRGGAAGRPDRVRPGSRPWLSLPRLGRRARRSQAGGGLPLAARGTLRGPPRAGARERAAGGRARGHPPSRSLGLLPAPP